MSTDLHMKLAVHCLIGNRVTGYIDFVTGVTGGRVEIEVVNGQSIC